jgi:acyl-coenzyme A synthetase/AMP-(fatty) acid ligase/thioesterase domain-containing protein
LTILDDIARQMSAEPDRLAAKDHRRSVTYAELDRESNRVANAVLEARGPGQEPVAIVLDPSIEAIAAVLGVLKAGKIRLSLDPQAPAARLLEFVEHAGVAVAITDEEHRAQLANVPSLMQIGYADTGQASDSDPAVEIADDSAATIFYTSGSTGRPKGVVLTHGSEAHAQGAREGPTAFVRGDRVALLHDLSFAASRRAISGPLLVGASIHVFDLRGRGADGLGAWLEREGITFLPLPTPILKAVTRQRSVAGPLPSLRCVSVGGDHVYREDLRGFLEAVGPGCVAAHGYGLTEVGVVSQLVLDDVAALADPVLPAGSLTRGVRVEFRDVEPDGVGRLVISAPRMAVGYWREPEMTAKAFVDDPADPGVTKFVSEDLGRFRPDGMLELRGRADARVKVRGYSVDLSDVERTIGGLEGVKESVVILDTTDRARSKLVAYVTGTDGALNPVVLRRRLVDQLPGYQIPASFVVLDALPYTERGKVDRRALPSPTMERPPLDEPWIGPRDEIEAALVRAWEDVLGIRPIGVHDKFSDLGADSLLITEAAAAASEALGRDLPFAFFIEATTVADAAALLRGGQADSLSKVVPLRRGGELPALFLVPGGGGDPFGFAAMTSHLVSDRPVYGLQARGARGRRLLADVPRVAEYWLEGVREVQPQGPYFLAGHSSGALIAYEMARRLVNQGETIARLILIDALAPDSARPSRRPPVGLKTWLRRALLTPYLFTDRRLPTRWRVIYPHERGTLGAARYRPPGYRGDAIVFRSTERGPDVPDDLGWSRLVEGEVRVVHVDGAHLPMLQAPYAGRLAAALQRALGPVEAPPSLVL